ncbi:MAG: LamG domain-containing protein [Candidatus Omnitrophica bacterium]|nr:LamG domain-containing protein [Candidatus Omnitrophota bacterium]
MNGKIEIMVFVGLFLVSSILVAGGRIVYPGEGNINFEEGTIEMWIKLDFEPCQTSEDYKILLPLFEFSEPEIKGTISISYICPAGGSSACWYVGFNCAGEKIFRLSAVPQNWKKDQWHHIALTWKGNTARFYLDGKIASEAKSNKPLTGKAKGGQIFIGDRWTTEKVKTEVVIDELRISCIERKSEELGFLGNLKVDPFTLLLEDFEQIIVEGQLCKTSPSIISSISGSNGGEVSGGKLTTGKFGNGLSLH